VVQHDVAGSDVAVDHAYAGEVRQAIIDLPDEVDLLVSAQPDRILLALPQHDTDILVLHEVQHNEPGQLLQAHAYKLHRGG